MILCPHYVYHHELLSKYILREEVIGTVYFSLNFLLILLLVYWKILIYWVIYFGGLVVSVLDCFYVVVYFTYKKCFLGSYM